MPLSGRSLIGHLLKWRITNLNNADRTGGEGGVGADDVLRERGLLEPELAHRTLLDVDLVNVCTQTLNIRENLE